MTAQIERLADLVPKLEKLVLDIAWSEKHKIIDIKNKAKLLLEFCVNDEKAIEIVDEVDTFIHDVNTLVHDVNNELKLEQGA